MVCSESRGFKIMVFIVAAILAVVLLAGIFYYNEIRNKKLPSVTEGTVMLIISIILFVVVVILWIWSIITLFFSRETRETAYQQAREYAGGVYQGAAGYLGAEPTGVIGYKGDPNALIGIGQYQKQRVITTASTIPASAV
jgi:preprotein translocase subunit SecY